MLYKTMVLELLRQYPEMHERLRVNRKLLATMEQLATALKSSHEDWKDRHRRTTPGGGESETASAALELALKELETALSSESPHDE